MEGCLKDIYISWTRLSLRSRSMRLDQRPNSEEEHFVQRWTETYRRDEDFSYACSRQNHCVWLFLWPSATVKLIVIFPSHFRWLVALKGGIVVYIYIYIYFEMHYNDRFIQRVQQGFWNCRRILGHDCCCAFNGNHGQFSLLTDFLAFCGISL